MNEISQVRLTQVAGVYSSVLVFSHEVTVAVLQDLQPLKVRCIWPGLASEKHCLFKDLKNANATSHARRNFR